MCQKVSDNYTNAANLCCSFALAGDEPDLERDFDNACLDFRDRAVSSLFCLELQITHCTFTTQRKTGFL